MSMTEKHTIASHIARYAYIKSEYSTDEITNRVCMALEQLKTSGYLSHYACFVGDDKRMDISYKIGYGSSVKSISVTLEELILFEIHES